MRRLIALPAARPSLRLLADQTAEVLAGISHALNGLALLVADPARPTPRRGSVRLRVPDWLPALVNAGRAFVVIGAAELFWIVTAWPNGASAVAWAAIGVILLAPRADHAYAAAIVYMLGTGLAVAFAAIGQIRRVAAGGRPISRLQPHIGLYLVPTGALIAQPRHPALFTAMAANFVPLLAPTNQMSYDTEQFYNSRARRSSQAGRRCAVVSVDPAAVAGISVAPVAGADFARSASRSRGVRSRERPRTGRAICTAGSRHCRTRRAIAACAAFGGPVGRYRNHPASPHCTAAESAVRARCGARSPWCGATARPQSHALPRSTRRSPRVRRRRSSGARQHPCDVGGA